MSDEGVIIKSGWPCGYRIARKPDGTEQLQAGYQCQGAAAQWVEWEFMPVVDVDENGKEIQ